jgi:nitrile hydratase subunit alpha
VSQSHVSRRGFLTTSSAAASLAALASCDAKTVKDKSGVDEYVQSEFSLRAKALVSLLTKKNLIDVAALDDIIEYFETKVGPHNGAKVVARSWVDPEYRKLLLEDATSAVEQFNLTGAQGTDIVAVANAPMVHNLVVCTLCSCYPWPLLGLPPTWYKDTAYRSRAVIDPRGLLKEFGLELAEDVELRVWDSTAELRYLVIPERPAGTEGMSEEELAQLVTRDSMVGVEILKAPS